MKNVLEYLEENVNLNPHKLAVIDEKHECTYEELQIRSQQIGTKLAYNIQRGEPVAVLLEKSISALAAFFGVVYAGGFYVSFHTDLPVTRLEQIQNVLKANYIITDIAHLPIAEMLFPQDRIYLIHEFRSICVEKELLWKIRRQMIDTDPLYANFTSGSTGIPKGVLISHRSVIDFIEIFATEFRINASDRIANQAPFDFDVSVKDIYTALKVGATLVLIPKTLFSKPKELLDYLCEHEVTTMIWAVSALCLITTFHGLDYRVPETVKRILFSGEVMPIKHLNDWRKHLPNTMFVNLYGPTEITCNCTYHILEKEDSYETGIPIGKAFDNEHVFLLDDENHEVTETDSVGEICVRGSALALGYYHSKKQTEKAFVENPLQKAYREMIYRTGDLGKYDENGNLFFCGRKDFQIKHMGHRIELEEIERSISAIEGVQRCCCIYDEKKHRIHGFYVGEEEETVLQQQIRMKLPVFMVPNTLMKIEEFPMTKNGKIDRKQLMERRNTK